MTVDALRIGFRHFGGQLQLSLALFLDSGVRHFQGFNQIGFLHFFHFAFHHHDVVHGSGDNQIQISFLHGFRRRIDFVFPIDAGNPHFGNRPVEGDVRHTQGRGGGQTGQRIGIFVAVTGNQGDQHLGVRMVIFREERTQGAVHQTGNQNLIIGGTGLSLEKTAGKTSDSGIFLLVFHLQGHEIHILSRFFFGTYGGYQHGVTHSHNSRTVRLFGQLAGFNGNHPAVAHVDFFSNDVHCLLVYLNFFTMFSYSLTSR